MSVPSAKKDIFEMIKLGLVLVCYAVASCTVLAVVNNFTSTKIAQNQVEKAAAAMKVVFPYADSFEAVLNFPKNSDSSISVTDVYLAKSDKNVVGAVAQISGPTYDRGKIILGIDSKGFVTVMQFLELTDSPGFGSKAKDSQYKLSNGKTFYEQFTNKNAAEGFEIGRSFDAISGATITSRAVGNLMNQGSEVLLQVIEAGSK